MNFYSSQFLWAVLSVLHLPLLAVTFLYWQCRDLDPIDVRRPRILLMALVSLLVNIWHILLRNLIGWSAESYLDIVIASVTVCPFCEAFLAFTLSLYIAINIIKEKMKYDVIWDPSDPEFVKTAPFTSFLLSEKFAYAWVFGQTLICSIIVVLHLSGQVELPDVISPLNQVNANDSLAGQTLAFIYGRGLLTIFCILILSYKLRTSWDAFGTKSMLNKIGLVVAIAFSFNIVVKTHIVPVTKWNVDDIFVLMLTDTAFILAFVLPVVQTRTQARWRRACSHGQESDLEAFLMTADGFQSFKKYLEKEFFVENLLFWNDVLSFRIICASGRLVTNGIRLAWAIFDKYLSISAPHELNLPRLQSKHLRAIFKDRSRDNPMITATMFDESAAHILLLMEYGPFRRFLNANPPAWQRFMESSEEKWIMQQVDRNVSKVPDISSVRHQACRSDLLSDRLPKMSERWNIVHGRLRCSAM